MAGIINKEQIGFILLLFTAHCLSDLALRPKNSTKKNLYWFLLHHSAIHFTVSLALTLFMLSLCSLIAVLAVTASHYLIDLFKAKVLRSYIKKGKLVDVIDQLMHFAAIILIVLLIF